MKYNINDLYNRIRNALLDIDGFSNATTVLDGVKSMHECNIPLFNGLDFVDVESKEGKDLQVVVHLIGRYGDNTFRYNLTVAGDDLIVKDDQEIIELILGKTRRIAKFKYNNDIIYMEATKKNGNCDKDAFDYINRNGGYTECDIKVYADAYSLQNDCGNLDVSNLEPDYHKHLVATKYGYPFARFYDKLFPDGYMDVTYLEKKLEEFFWVGILQSKHWHEYNMDGFKSMLPRSK